MAGIRKTIEEAVSGKKKHGFFDGLKNWVISPGGIITIVLFIGVIWYVNHKTKEST